MNARKALVILGIVTMFLIAVTVTVALWAINKLITERNRQKIAAAAKARWKKEHGEELTREDKAALAEALPQNGEVTHEETGKDDSSTSGDNAAGPAANV